MVGYASFPIGSLIMLDQFTFDERNFSHKVLKR